MLEIEDFTVSIGGNALVDIPHLRIEEGERLGLVGESGSGKTLTAMSTLGLQPHVARVSGTVRLDGQDTSGFTDGQMAAVRGKIVGVIFQDPLRSLNPLMRIGDQIAEPLRIHDKLSKRDAAQKVHALMEEVSLPDIPELARRYPHQLSGGQRQRVLIAMAIACGPKLLIADEPTTALDVTVQKDILDLIMKISDQRNMAVLFVSHNLGVIRAISHRIAVLYGGRLMEIGPARDILRNPRHQYTHALIGANPGRSRVAMLPAHHNEALLTIEGTVPSAGSFPSGCTFRDRCTAAIAACARPVPLSHAGPGHDYHCNVPVTSKVPA